MQLSHMTLEDAPRLLELSQLVNWNHTLADCQFLLADNHTECVCVRDNGTIIATAGMPVYGNNQMGFINLVIVHPEYRHRGLATAMIEALLQARPGLQTFRLHATPEGSHVYAPLGFKTTRSMSIFASQQPQFGHRKQTIENVTEHDLPAIVQLDQTCFGLPRPELIANNLRRYGDLALKIQTANQLKAVCLGRRGRCFRQITMVEGGDEQDSLDLITAAASLESTLPLTVILFDEHQDACREIQSLGMVKTRELIEMEFGEAGTPPHPAYHAIFGGDFG